MLQSLPSKGFIGKVFHPLELAGWPECFISSSLSILLVGVELVRQVCLVAIEACLLGFGDLDVVWGLDMYLRG
jgi:hypothetical protein